MTKFYDSDELCSNIWCLATDDSNNCLFTEGKLGLNNQMQI